MSSTGVRHPVKISPHPCRRPGGSLPPPGPPLASLCCREEKKQGFDPSKSLTQNRAQRFHLNSEARHSDHGVRHLAKMKQLQWIALWHTRVTDAGAKDLAQALPKLKVYR
jgi:hypothetical protein